MAKFPLLATIICELFPFNVILSLVHCGAGRIGDGT